VQIDDKLSKKNIVAKVSELQEMELKSCYSYSKKYASYDAPKNGKACWRVKSSCYVSDETFELNYNNTNATKSRHILFIDNHFQVHAYTILGLIFGCDLRHNTIWGYPPYFEGQQYHF